MDGPSVRKAGILFIGILCAYMLADILTRVFLGVFRITGAVAGVISLIVFGIVFFSILEGIGRLTGIGVFGFWGRQD